MANDSRPPVSVPPSGAELIAAERQRQVSAEGWTPEWDSQHTNGELALAAACYIAAATRTWFNAQWPWSPNDWNPGTDPLRTLVKAGALIVAEIDRQAAAIDRGEGGCSVSCVPGTPSDAEASTEAPPSPQPPLCGLCFVNPATSHLTFSGSVAGQEYDDTVSVCEACTEGWLGSPVSGADQ